MPRPIVVPTAAPVTPNSGKNPTPKIKHGDSTMFNAFARIKTRIAIAASPAPRNIAFNRNIKTTTAFPPSMIRMNREPSSSKCGFAPSSVNICGANTIPTTLIATDVITPRYITCAAD